MVEGQADSGMRLALLDSRAFESVEQNRVLGSECWWCAIDVRHHGDCMIVSTGEASDAARAKIERVSGYDVETVGAGIDRVREISRASHPGESLRRQEVRHRRASEVSGEHDPVANDDVVVIAGEREVA